MREIFCDHLLLNTCNVDRDGERQHFGNRRHLPASPSREEVRASDIATVLRPSQSKQEAIRGGEPGAVKLSKA